MVVAVRFFGCSLELLEDLHRFELVHLLVSVLRAFRLASCFVLGLLEHRIVIDEKIDVDAFILRNVNLAS